MGNSTDGDRRKIKKPKKVEMKQMRYFLLISMVKMTIMERIIIPKYVII